MAIFSYVFLHFFTFVTLLLIPYSSISEEMLLSVSGSGFCGFTSTIRQKHVPECSFHIFAKLQSLHSTTALQ
jgi:hypothetical protein